jgi:hypothetical protein
MLGNITTEMNEKLAAYHVKTREFKVNDKVQNSAYSNLDSNPRVKWEFGTIFGRTSLAHYDVTVDRKHHTRHVDVSSLAKHSS